MIIGNKIHIGSRRKVTIGSKLNQAWYGVRINEANSSPDLTRLAKDMTLHASLPVHEAMKPCLLLENGTVNYYLKPDDWTKKADGTASKLDGTDGDVMIEVPQYYRRVDNPSSGVYDHIISLQPLSGGQKVNKFYVGAYEGAVDRVNLKLHSVINTTTSFRGGNNNAAWDAESRSLLGKPATLLPLENGTVDGFRRYARNRGSVNWNVMTYRASMLIYELYMIEFATLNSQKAVNTTLTVEGYKQGGLGNGVTTAASAEWSAYNSYYPFISCGLSNSLGMGSGELSVNITDFGGAGVNRSFTVPRFRGIENPFGHIWEWQDGANVFHEAAGGVSKFYTCDDPINFADNTETNYDYRSNLPSTSTYVKRMTHDDKGVLIPLEGGGGISSYFCDYYYTPGLINAWRSVLRGGDAYSGSNAGFVDSPTSDSASLAIARIGSRVMYMT